MNTVLRTAALDAWLTDLKDPQGKARIIARIRSAERGQFGDCRSVGRGVSKIRVRTGPEYRLYSARTENLVYVLLCGGTKRG